MFLCTHTHSNLIIFLLSCRHRHFSFMISYEWGGVGWGGTIMFMFLCTHTHRGTATPSSFLQSCRHGHCSFMISYQWGGVGWDNNVLLLSCKHRHCSFMISYGWGGVGWDKNAHVPVQTQAQQPHHLSCCPADTGTALS